MESTPSAPPLDAKLTDAPGATLLTDAKVRMVLCAALPLWTTVMLPCPERRLKAPAVSLEPFGPEMNWRSPPSMLIAAELPMRSAFSPAELSRIRIPPERMLTLLALMARPAVPCSTRLPPFTVKLPESILVPVSFMLPTPDFTSPPVPERTPENVDAVPSPPALSVPAPSVTLPAPASEPMVALNPATLNVAPLATFTRDADGLAAATPRVSVPTFTSVLPL